MVCKRQPSSQLPPKVRHTAAAVIRGRGAEMQVASVLGTTSRRAVLGIIASAPLVGMAGAELTIAIGPPVETTILRRTREGRQLSRTRYHTAESFFAPIEAGFLSFQSDLLYQTGIALQLALSSHLLDIGFDDAWCAHNIGLHVDRSLTYANATGLGHECPELARLAEFLSPYGRWRNPYFVMRKTPCPFSCERIRELTRELLDQVREVTGHPQPRERRG